MSPISNYPVKIKHLFGSTEHLHKIFYRLEITAQTNRTYASYYCHILRNTALALLSAIYYDLMEIAKTSQN